jgi:hypothetical protein
MCRESEGLMWFPFLSRLCIAFTHPRATSIGHSTMDAARRLTADLDFGSCRHRPGSHGNSWKHSSSVAQRFVGRPGADQYGRNHHRSIADGHCARLRVKPYIVDTGVALIRSDEGAGLTELPDTSGDRRKTDHGPRLSCLPPLVGRPHPARHISKRQRRRLFGHLAGIRSWPAPHADFATIAAMLFGSESRTPFA